MRKINPSSNSVVCYYTYSSNLVVPQGKEISKEKLKKERQNVSRRVWLLWRILPPRYHETMSRMFVLLLWRLWSLSYEVLPDTFFTRRLTLLSVSISSASPSRQGRRFWQFITRRSTYHSRRWNRSELLPRSYHVQEAYVVFWLWETRLYHVLLSNRRSLSPFERDLQQSNVKVHS